MSYTEMLVVRKNGDVESYKEYKNSHRFAIPIWKYMWEKYIGGKYSISVNHDKLWPLSKNIRIPPHKRAVLMSTYDKVIVKSDNFERFIDDVQTFPLFSYHSTSIAKDIHFLLFDEDVIGVCWNATSISCDFWTVYEKEDEWRPYNIFKDTDGHWFLYESLDDKENK